MTRLRGFAATARQARFRGFAAVTTAALVVIGDSARVFACPVCFGAEESSMIDGTKLGIMVLLGITVAVQARSRGSSSISGSARNGSPTPTSTPSGRTSKEERREHHD